MPLSVSSLIWIYLILLRVFSLSSLTQLGDHARQCRPPTSIDDKIFCRISMNFHTNSLQKFDELALSYVRIGTVTTIP
jgi:hypothetical protein